MGRRGLRDFHYITEVSTLSYIPQGVFVLRPGFVLGGCLFGAVSAQGFQVQLSVLLLRHVTFSLFLGLEEVEREWR